jgi:hypothetical protein
MDYHDKRRIRLEGRKACQDGYPRISRFRAMGLEFADCDREWCRGYDEVAARPDVKWFTPDGEFWRCGAKTKAGHPCQAIVDRRGWRCARHRERPPPHPGPQQLGLPI